MRLEGTLDAFSLPDIFQLLSYTKKTGTLHLRRGTGQERQHGVVHLRDGAVTGGRGDVGRQALGRRLVGAGLVPDDALARAVQLVLDNPGSGLAKTLAELIHLDAAQLSGFAREQATDAVFELLRWPVGEFAFIIDEPDPDDLGASLTVEEIVAEAQRRLQKWDLLVESVPSMTAVVRLATAPNSEPILSRDEWALLSLVEGARTVGELVALAGTGEYVVVVVLGGLADRGLVTVGAAPSGVSPLAQRQQLLDALERPEVPGPDRVAGYELPRQAALPARAVPTEPTGPTGPTGPAAPRLQPVPADDPMATLGLLATSSVRATVIPASLTSPSGPAAGVGVVHGAHALQLDVLVDSEPVTSNYLDRDPDVNKSLLLRLIAGVRGL